MTIVCRLIRLSPEVAEELSRSPGSLALAVSSADTYSDVYRYWAAIEFLLLQHRKDSGYVGFLSLGNMVNPESGARPSSRVIGVALLKALAGELANIEPEDLVGYYDPVVMDAAGVYPSSWVEWEETFDPLGQVLEHYHFLREFSLSTAQGGDALLLHFEESDD